jgi:hypothetical protein
MDLRTIKNRKGSGETLFVFVLTTIILIVCSFFILNVYFKHVGITAGISFLNHDLAGLRQDKALERVEQIVSSTYSLPIYLKYKEQMWILRYNEHFKLNLDCGKIVLDALEAGRQRGVFERIINFIKLDYPEIDIPWTPLLDRDYSLKNISRAYSQISQEKIFASHTENENEILITMLSKNTAVNQIIDELEKSIQKNPIVDYRVIELANINKDGETLTCKINDENHGFVHRIAESTTSYDVNERSKVHNIDLVLQKLRGLIINPSDIVSFNELTGPRTIETNYEKVSLLLEDKIQEDIEGGVNQVATTLYNAVLKTGLRMEERSISNYYTPAIDYCQPGFEAFVRSEQNDLKFENNLDFPLLIECSAQDGQLSIQVLGVKPLPYTINLRAGRLQKVAYDTKLVKDSSLLRGLEVIDQIGIDGVNVKIFRTFLGENNHQIKEELLYDEADTYLARSSIVRIGTGSSQLTRPYQSSTEKSENSTPLNFSETGEDELNFMSPDNF